MPENYYQIVAGRQEGKTKALVDVIVKHLLSPNIGPDFKIIVLTPNRGIEAVLKNYLIAALKDSGQVYTRLNHCYVMNGKFVDFYVDPEALRGMRIDLICIDNEELFTDEKREFISGYLRGMFVILSTATKI